MGRRGDGGIRAQHHTMPETTRSTPPGGADMTVHTHRQGGRFTVTGRPPLALRLAAAASATGAALLWGVAMIRVQQHFSALRDSGDALSGFATLLADGTAPITVISGWSAALFFALAVLRLRRDVPEPPVTRGQPEQQSAAVLREGLRREYRAVCAGLFMVCVVALLDTGRLAVIAAASVAGVATGDGRPLPVLPLFAEAAGLLAASLFLGLWAAAFRRQLEQFGAL